MKKYLLTAILLLGASFFAFTQTIGISVSPPADGNIYATGETITITAVPDPPDYAKFVEFYGNGTLLYTDRKAPWEYSWEINLSGAIELYCAIIPKDQNTQVQESNTVTISAEDQTSSDPTPDPTSNPSPPPPPPSSNISIFGVWHAGDHYCDWSVVPDPDMVKFDEENHWLIDRGDGNGPSVNLVVLTFVNPWKLLNNITDEYTINGIPRGMTKEVVEYFRNAGIRVMLSIGGITYTDDWDEALATDPVQLALNAVAVAENFNVGIEIDYERGSDPNTAALNTFISTYREAFPYIQNGTEAKNYLTIDLAAGDRYLIELTRYATENWLDINNPVLNYANAMVARQSGSPTEWQEHIDGKANYNPQIPPLNASKLTGGLYLKGNLDNCTDFYNSEQYQYANYVQTSGMLGYMFWAAGVPSARGNYVGTFPPDTCEQGMGTAAFYFDFPLLENRTIQNSN
ncbi:MAG: hypothetical protein JW969_16275 [Spirochaetales bacterium]|nr:hypothetical protein [Spirochaetales bacterium]